MSDLYDEWDYRDRVMAIRSVISSGRSDAVAAREQAELYILAEGRELDRDPMGGEDADDLVCGQAIGMSPIEATKFMARKRSEAAIRHEFLLSGLLLRTHIRQQAYPITKP